LEGFIGETTRFRLNVMRWALRVPQLVISKGGDTQTFIIGNGSSRHCLPSGHHALNALCHTIAVACECDALQLAVSSLFSSVAYGFALAHPLLA
jgi:hypothetical protein